MKSSPEKAKACLVQAAKLNNANAALGLMCLELATAKSKSYESMLENCSFTAPGQVLENLPELKMYAAHLERLGEEQAEAMPPKVWSHLSFNLARIHEATGRVDEAKKAIRGLAAECFAPAVAHEAAYHERQRRAVTGMVKNEDQALAMHGALLLMRRLGQLPSGTLDAEVKKAEDYVGNENSEPSTVDRHNYRLMLRTLDDYKAKHQIPSHINPYRFLNAFCSASVEQLKKHRAMTNGHLKSESFVRISQGLEKTQVFQKGHKASADCDEMKLAWLILGERKDHWPSQQAAVPAAKEKEGSHSSVVIVLDDPVDSAALAQKEAAAKAVSAGVKTFGLLARAPAASALPAPGASVELQA